MLKFLLFLLVPLSSFASSSPHQAWIMHMMGIRSASPLSPLAIRIVIGPSATPAAAEALAYRIVSPDDPAYSYDRFITPIAASAFSQPELPLPNNFSGNRNLVSSPLSRTIVHLDLPSPMSPGLRYGVVAIGRNSTMITAAQTGAEFIYHPPGSPPEIPPIAPPDVLRVMGLRLVSSIGNGIIRLEFGHAFATLHGTNPAFYRVSRNGHPCVIRNIGRFSRPEVYLPIGWPFPVFQHHEVFLALDHPLADGDRISVLVAPAVTSGNALGSFLFDHRISLSSALKVNQLGYLPGATKTAYLGRWLGSFPELQQGSALLNPELLFGESPASSSDNALLFSPAALRFSSPPFFELIDEASGQCVLRKRASLRFNGNNPDGGPNFSGENLYALDFSEFNTPGRYFIAIPSVGRSFSFDIDNDVYRAAFATQAHGLLMQRCGQELKEPFSEWRRIACHRAGVIPTTDKRYDSDSLWGRFREYQLMRKNPDYPSTRQAQLWSDPSLAADFRLASMGGKQLDFDPAHGFTAFFRFRKGGGTQRYGGDILTLGELKVTACWGIWRLDDGRVHCDYERLPDGETQNVVLLLEPLPALQKYRARLYFDGVLGAETVSDTAPGKLFRFGHLSGLSGNGAGIAGMRIYRRVFSPSEITALCTPVLPWIPQVLPIWGGHHDAGDYNPRAHLDVAQVLMSVYEAAPRKFFDGQLNIPENRNGIPDILDEALWALRLWIGLQREDGAVYDGTGSLRDVNFIQTVEMDHTGDYAWAVDAGASFRYAGAMAQAARILRPFRADLAATYLGRAQLAYDWAAAHRPDVNTLRQSARYDIAPRAYAAAELLHTTGAARYGADFLTYTPWRIRPDAPIATSDYDLSEAAYSYVNLPETVGDPTVKNRILELIRREAESYIRNSSRMAYPFLRHPDAPIDWGTGAYENFARPVVQMWRLTGDRRYFDWMVRTADNTLGANPLGMCWITGLGSQSVYAPLHSSRYRPAGVAAAGLQEQGPNAKFNSYSCRETIYPPATGTTAALYRFADMHFAIGMNEGTTANMIQTLVLFGLLLPDVR